MERLNLPPASVKIKKENEKYKIFDAIRRKYVALTPEEWVRQHFIHYLVATKKYPAGLTSVEHQIVINRLRQRADIVVFTPNGKPLLIVECKAPSVAITTEVFDQALRYNTVLGVRIIIVTNGLTHMAALLMPGGRYSMIDHIPGYQEVNNLLNESNDG